MTDLRFSELPPDYLLTINDVAAQFAISRATVYRLINTGELPVPVRVGERMRFRASDLEAYLEKSKS